MRLALHMVIKVFIVFVALGPPFPQVHLSVGGGGGGGQQASSVFRAALHMVISDFKCL